MNYFELFEIPVQLKVNPALLSKRFFELSRKYHPDHSATESAEVQAEALDRSALLNKAWKTFQNPDATIKYVLLEKGLLQEEEKYELPPAFLMEVLEINEQLMEMDETTDRDKLSSIISQLSSEIYEPVKETVENYKDGIVTEKELLQVKEYYYKKKYLDRITRELTSK
ncbi:MAG TPA: Fe-S protein assembly co-chaperone HscB [Chitinophagaceae bacterium]|jgi:molecular chaperone HscB|nr:Fe-S protein assembly co-chaperone HscB [Chitinophagaceae bacterium]